LFPFNGENGNFSELKILGIEVPVERLFYTSPVRRILFGEEL